MAKSTSNKSIFPKSLNSKTIGLIFALLIPFIFIAQVPEFIKFNNCLASGQNNCEASSSMPIFFAMMVSFPVSLFLIKLFKKISWSDLGLGKIATNKKQTFKLLVIGLLLIFVANTIISLLAKKIPVLGEEQFNFGDNLTLQKIWPFALFGIVFAPFTEEMLFRGFEFSILGRRFGIVAAAIITSLTFGLAHGQIAVSIVTATLGLYLCYLYTQTKSLWPSIILHAINNTIAVVALILSK